MGTSAREVVWTEAAVQELEEALEYLAERSPSSADDLFEAAMEAAESLSTLSERGRWVPELEDQTMRELIVASYRLMYEVRDDRVAVIAFLHGARDFGAWWRAR
jgi:toxin ParE1/3/4